MRIDRRHVEHPTRYTLADEGIRALLDLEPYDYLIWYCRYCCELNLRQLAERVGCTHQGVKQRLDKIRREINGKVENR